MIDYGKKYTFKSYNPDYPMLAAREISHIKSSCNVSITIEHVGSTAVSGLGGKGFIDLYATVDNSQIITIQTLLEQLGYEQKPSGGEVGVRIFFQRESDDQVYHVHLAETGSQDFTRCVVFRDFLRSHPKSVIEYENIKHRASKKAQLVKTKEEKKIVYMREKEQFILESTEKAMKIKEC